MTRLLRGLVAGALLYGLLMAAHAQVYFTNSVTASALWATMANWTNGAGGGAPGTVNGSNLYFVVTGLSTNNTTNGSSFGFVSWTANVTNQQSSANNKYYFAGFTNTAGSKVMWNIRTYFTNLNITPVIYNDGTLRMANLITNLTASALVYDGAGSTTNSSVMYSTSAGVTKTGSGILTLTGANTFNGGLTLSNGTLNINAAAALGNGTFTIANDGVTINNSTGAGIANSKNNAVAWNGDFTFTGTKDLNLGTGAVTLGGGTRTVQSEGTGVLTLGGNIGDGGNNYGMIKLGTGVLALSGANTYGGLTDIREGVLSIGSTSALPGWDTFGRYVVSNGAALAVADAVVDGDIATLLGTGNFAAGASLGFDTTAGDREYAVALGDTGAGALGLLKLGANILILSGANTYGGGTFIYGGMLNVTNDSALGAAGGVLTFNGGALWTSGDMTLNNRTITLLGAGTNLVDAGTTLTITNDVSGAGGLVKRGAGTLTLGGVNTYSGTTYIYDGVVNITGSNAWTGAGNTDFYQVHSNAVLNISGDFYSGGQFRVGYESGTTATVNQTAGTFIGAGTYGQLIGNSAGTVVGIYNLYGGMISNAAGAELTLGVNTNNTGIFNLFGGILYTPTLEVGRNTGAAAFTTNIFTQSGGTATVTTLTMGRNNADSPGQFMNLLITNGSFSASAFNYLAPATGQTATIYLGTGAVVTLPAFPTARGANATVKLTFDGGTLSPYAASANYMSNLTAAFITTNGAFFNVAAGKDITVVQVLQDAPDAGQSGILIKQGDGSLTLAGANTYSGGTDIRAGTLRATNTAALPNFAVAGKLSVSNGATLAVNYGGGSDWSSGDVASLLGNSTAFAAGSALGFDTSDGSSEYANAITLAGLGVTKLGANTLILSGANTFGGGVTINGGTLNVTNDSALGAAGGGLTFNGGTLWTSGDMTLNNRSITLLGAGTNIVDDGTTLTITNDMSGAGALTKDGAGTLILSGVNSYAGATKVNGGTLTFTSTTSNSIAALTVAGGAAGARVNINGPTTLGSGALVAGSAAGARSVALIAADVMTTGALTFGNTAGGAGAGYQTGGDISDGQMNVGPNVGAYGYYGLNGGSLTNTSFWIQVGAGGIGVFDQYGGTNVIKSSGMLAGNGSGTGIVYFAGGVTTSSLAFYEGYNNASTRSHAEVTITTNATVIINNSWLFNRLITATGYASTNYLNLDGGVLQVNTISKNAGGGLTVVSFNGGTLRAGTSGNLFGLGTNAPDATYIFGNGAIFDSSNYTSTVAQNLEAPSGSGVVSMAISPLAGYIGAPYVAISGGGGTGATAVALFDYIQGAVTGIVMTSAGVGYTDKPTVTLLGGGSSDYPIDASAITLAANTSGGLIKRGAGTLLLSGANTYGGTTVIEAGALSIATTAALPGWDQGGRYAVSNGAALAVGNTVSDDNIVTILGTHNFAAGASLGFDTTDGDRTYASNIVDTAEGALGLFKVNTNALTLTAANSYTGGTRLNGGTLVLSNDAALGTSGDITFGGGTLQYGLGFGTDLNARFKNNTGAITLDDNGQTITLAGSIDGSNTGGLTKLGGGVLTLSGVNSFSGTTIISNGVLQLGIVNALPSAGAVLVAGGGYDLNGFTTVTNGVISSTSGAISNGTLVGSSYVLSGGTVAAVLAGSGALTNRGGTTVLSGVNTYSGGTTLEAGTLSLGDYANLPTAGGLNFNGGILQVSALITNLDAYTVNWDTFNGGLNIGSGNTFTLGNNLGAGSSLTNLGTGYLVFTGNSVGSVVAGGATGALVLSNTGGVAISGNLQIGTGSADCYVRLGADEQIADTSIVSFGSGNYGRWVLLGHTETVGGLNDPGGHGVIENNDFTNYPGQATDNTGISTLIVSNSGDYVYAGYLRDWGNTSGGLLQLIKDGSGAQTLSGTRITYTQPTLIKNGALILSNTTGFASAVTITGGQLLLATATAMNNKHVTNLVANGLGFLNTNAFTVGGLTGSGSVALTNNAGVAVTLTLGGNNTSGNFSGALTDAGSVRKTGTGTETLGGSNSYSGGTLISAGYLVLNNNDALGTGGLIMTSTVVRVTLGDGVTITNAIAVYTNAGTSGNGLLQHTGAGTGTLSGPIIINNSTAAGGHFGSTGGGTLVISGPITSSVEVVSRIGTIVYSGGGSYAAFSISQDTTKLGANNGLATNAVLQVAGSATGTFDLNGFNQTLAGIRDASYTRTITNTVDATQVVLTLGNTDPTNFVYSGTLAGNLALVMNGAFTQTLSGATVKYAGPTTINGGVLALSNSTAFVSPTTLNGGQLLLLSATAAQLATITNDVTGSGLVFSANTNAYTLGGLAGDVALTNAAGDIVALSLGNNNVDLIYGGVLSQGGSLTKVGIGVLQLTGANTYSGGTTINGGLLGFGSGALPFTGNVLINGASALVATGAFTTVTGWLGRVDTTSAGAIAMVGDNSETLDFNVGSFSNLFLGMAAGSTGTYSGVLTPYGTTYRLGGGGGELIYPTAMGGASDLVIGGGNGGTVVLAAASTFSGGTVIDNGNTLRIGIADALPTTGMVTLGDVNGVGNLDLTAYSQTLDSLLVQSSSATATNTITIGPGQTLTINGTGGLTIGLDLGGTSSTKSLLTMTGGGALVITNISADVVVGKSQASQNSNNSGTLDLSGLSSVTLGSSGTALNEVRVGYGTTSSGLLTLSDTSNTITAAKVQVGNSNGQNAGANIALILGAGVNELAVDTLNIGISKASGTVKFASQTNGSPGTVTMGGLTGAATDITIGSKNGTATASTPNGILDLRGHTATVTAGTVTIGLENGNSTGSAIGNLYFDDGTFTVSNLNMATKSTASAVSATATLLVGGGVFTVNSGGSFSLASQSGGGTANGALTLSGGVFRSYAPITVGPSNSTSTINLNGGTLDMTGTTIGSADAPLSIFNLQSGTLMNLGEFNGGAALVKINAGTLTLAGVNIYSGGTSNRAGVIQLGGDNVLGYGTLIMSGGALTADSTTPRILTNALQITTASGFGNAVNNGLLTLSGPVDFAGAGRNLTNFSDVVISGSSGNGGIISKRGAGTLTLLGGIHDWSLGGALQVELGSFILDGATVTNTDAFRVMATMAGGVARLVVTNGAVLISTNKASNLRLGYSPGGNASGTNILDVAGRITMNATSTAGQLQMGTLCAKAIANLLPGGELEVANVTNMVGGVTEFNFDGGILRAREATTTFMLGLDAANVLARGAVIDSAGYNITVAQALLDGGGNGGLIKLGAGTLTLSGNSTYSGATVISNGTLKVANTVGSLASSTPVYVDALGIMDFSGNIQTIAGLTGSGVVSNGGGTLTINLTSPNTFGGALKGASALTLTGGGSMNLLGTNSFSGSTIVSNASYYVNGLHNGGLITVLSNGLVGGSGPINALYVSNGGTYALGNSLATQSVSSLTLTNGGILAMELGNNANDQVIVTNSLTIAGGQLKLNLAAYSFNPGATITLVDWTKASGFAPNDPAQWFTLNDAGGPNDGMVWTNGVLFGVSGGLAGSTNFFTINYDDLANGVASTHGVTLTAVPEPGTASLLGLVGIVLLIRRLRTRQPARG